MRNIGEGGGGIRSGICRRATSLGRAAALSLAACAAVLSVARAPRAEAQVAEAAVEAIVADETGAFLPGVAVELKNPATGLSRTGVTNVAGTVRFNSIPPGTVRVKATLMGFEVAEQDVVLRIGQIAKPRLTLKTKAVSEAITVLAQAPLVDVYKMDDSTNISPEQIKELPVANRNFEQLAFIAPGVQRERGGFRFINGGPVIGAGGNASQSTILVDGVDYTDPTLGLAKTRISQDAISEFRVINNQFDTEVGGSSGGALSILTKSGTNDLSGTVYGFYRDQNLQAKPVTALQANPFDKGQYGLTLGGPIAKDRVHFFLSAEYNNTNSFVNFRPGGAYTSLAEDVKVPYDQTLLYGGLDFTHSDKARSAVRLDYERYRQENYNVGGVADVSSGRSLDRDNYNMTMSNTWNPKSTVTNELRGQVGTRKFHEPLNTVTTANYYSLGSTLITGSNILGDQLGQGNQWELRDTLYLNLSGKTGTHDVKIGAGFQRVNEQSRLDLYQTGLFMWATDGQVKPAGYPYASAPYLYAWGEGSSDVKLGTNRVAAFIQDDWRPSSRLTLSVGLRWDYDSDGNDPNISIPLIPNGRPVDTTNFQPRFGFSWDVTGSGQVVARGGAGLFGGRYLLQPAIIELQQNGTGGRKLYTSVNGYWLGLPQLFWMDPANPTKTGTAVLGNSKLDLGLLDTTMKTPRSQQYSLGLTWKLDQTGLWADVQGVWVKGMDEIAVRDVNWNGNGKTPARPNSTYNQINTYTNEGHSEYKAIVLSLNGTLRGGHVVTASATFADKRNISDDFSPALTAYPSDPANIEAEYGRAQSDERFRLIVSGVFRLPLGFSVSPIFEYGSGQPWTTRLGYDANGDGKTSDRPVGVERNSNDGPSYTNVSLRLSKVFSLGAKGQIELIAEGFNLFNSINYDPNSVDNAMYTGATAASAVKNPRFGQYLSTLDARQIQFGARISF